MIAFSYVHVIPVLRAQCHEADRANDVRAPRRCIVGPHSPTEMTSVGGASWIPGVHMCRTYRFDIRNTAADPAASIRRAVPGYFRASDTYVISDSFRCVRRSHIPPDYVSHDIAKVAQRGINNSSSCRSVFFSAEIFTASP